MIQLQRNKEFTHYTFIARVNIPNNDGDEIIMIQMETESEIYAVLEKDQYLKHLSDADIDCIWYRIINNRNGLTIA